MGKTVLSIVLILERSRCRSDFGNGLLPACGVCDQLVDRAVKGM